MKLTDPIPGEKFDRITYVLMFVGAVLLLISVVLKVVGVGAYILFGGLGFALVLIGVHISETFALDAHVDDHAIAANKELGPDEPKHRVGSAPWAYYGLAVAIVCIALIFAIPLLRGT
jgi:hypothetical protein